MDIVNWELLEKQLKNFNKTARSEVVNPNDRMYFVQPQQSSTTEQTTNTGPTDQTENQTNSFVSRRTPNLEDGSEEISNSIEVENFKGKMKKIDLDDYSVEILANDRPVFRGLISKIASGMYKTILESHGADKTLGCILKDFVKAPEIFAERKLSLMQAKTVISSLNKTLGQIPEHSLKDIVEKVERNSKSTLLEWIQKQKM